MSAATDAVVATYVIETGLDLERAAEILADEQSTGTFVRVERESDALRDRFAARVVEITELPPADSSPLPGAVGDLGHRRRARVRDVNRGRAHREGPRRSEGGRVVRSGGGGDESDEAGWAVFVVSSGG